MLTIADTRGSRALVDVGIPTFRRPRYLTEAIESVLSQTLPDWRLVIGNNDPDGAEIDELVRPYLNDPRVSYLRAARSEESLLDWQSAARNFTQLIRAGHAPYVALLNDDDRWGPEFLERRVSFLEAHPACGLVFSGCVQIDAEGEVIRISLPELPEGVHPPEETVPLFLRHNLISAPTAMWRRSVQVAVGDAFDERMLWFDWEMWIRIALRFEVGCLSVTDDAAYRVHGEQISVRARWGEHKVVFHEHAAELARRERPGALLDEREQRRVRSSAYRSAALDAVEQGHTARALSRAARALDAYPRAIIDPHMLGVLALIPLGPLGTWVARRLRPIVRQRELAG